MIGAIKAFLNPTTILVAAVAGLGLSNWWTYHKYVGARDSLTTFTNQVKAAGDKAVADHNLDAIIRQRNNERVADAQAQRDKVIAEQLAGSAVAVGRLQREVARLNSRVTPTDTVAAGYAHEASVARGLLQQCAERYRRVDGDAKQLGSQVIGLQSFVTEVCRAGQPATWLKEDPALPPQ